MNYGRILAKGDVGSSPTSDLGPKGDVGSSRTYILKPKNKFRRTRMHRVAFWAQSWWSPSRRHAARTLVDGMGHLLTKEELQFWRRKFAHLLTHEEMQDADTIALYRAVELQREAVDQHTGYAAPAPKYSTPASPFGPSSASSRAPATEYTAPTSQFRSSSANSRGSSSDASVDLLVLSDQALLVHEYDRQRRGILHTAVDLEGREVFAVSDRQGKYVEVSEPHSNKDKIFKAIAAEQRAAGNRLREQADRKSKKRCWMRQAAAEGMDTKTARMLTKKAQTLHWCELSKGH
jgi:hypothetical protein